MKTLPLILLGLILLLSCRENSEIKPITSPRDIDIGKDLLNALGGQHFMVKIPKDTEGTKTLELVFRTQDGAEMVRMSSQNFQAGEIVRIVFFQNYSETHSRVSMIGSEFSSSSDIEKISGGIGYVNSEKPFSLGTTLFTIQTDTAQDSTGRVPRVEVSLRLSNANS